MNLDQTRAKARVKKRAKAVASTKECGAPLCKGAQAMRPERRKPLFCGLVCACPCGCASRTTVASQVKPQLDSVGAEMCSECFINIQNDIKGGTLCRILALVY